MLWFWAAAASPEASWLAYLGPFVPFGGLATLVIIWQQRQMMAKDERIAQLGKLADLKAQGVLNDAEFEAQKRLILGS